MERGEVKEIDKAQGLTVKNRGLTVKSHQGMERCRDMVRCFILIGKKGKVDCPHLFSSRRDEGCAQCQGFTGSLEVSHKAIGMGEQAFAQ